MKKDMLKVSIITVCFNCEKLISRTVHSVLKQNYKNLEYIVVDGGSTDRTYSIVCSFNVRFRDKGICYKHITEHDNGIFDAMNKATRMATGDFLIFINADDLLAKTSTISDVFLGKNYDGFGVIYGNHYTLNGNYRKAIYAGVLSKLTLAMVFSHQAAFVRRVDLLSNPYDLKYNICADYNYFLSAYLSGIKFYYVNEFVSYFAEGGECQKNIWKTTKQVFEVRKHQGVITKKNYIFNYLRMKQYIIRKVFFIIFKPKHSFRKYEIINSDN